MRHEHLGHDIHVRSWEQSVGKSLNYEGNRRFPTFRRCSAPRSEPFRSSRPSPHPARGRYGRSRGHRIRRQGPRSPQDDPVVVHPLLVRVSLVTCIEVWCIDLRSNGWRATRIPAASSRFPAHRTLSAVEQPCKNGIPWASGIPLLPLLTGHVLRFFVDRVPDLASPRHAVEPLRCFTSTLQSQAPSGYTSALAGIPIAGSPRGTAGCATTSPYGGRSSLPTRAPPPPWRLRDG